MLKPRPIALFLVLAMAGPALAQNRANEKWVATWATALVARAQPGAGGGRGQGPAAAAPQAPAGPAQGPAAAPAGQPAAAGGRGGGQPPVTLNNQTLRQIVRTSIGGSRVRIVLSNAFGTAPIEIGAGHVALRDKDATVVAASTKALTFSGNGAGTILAGATLVSDPVDLTVAPVSDL